MLKETIGRRVGRLVSGSFNAIVSAAENSVPEVIMAEALREIDGAIDEVKGELGKTIAAKQLTDDTLQRDKAKLEELYTNAKLALGEDKEDLAAAAAAKIVSLEDQIPVLETSITDCNDQIAELEAYVKALMGKRSELEADIEALKSVESSSPSNGNGNGKGSVEDTVETAENVIRRMQKNAGLDKGSDGIDTATEAKLAELSDLAKDNKVKAKLAQLKSL